MNTIVLALVKNIFSSKHEHHHLVKAIPKDVHPLKCYKYKNNKAIRIPCNEVPDAEETTSNNLQDAEYVDMHGKPVHLTDDSMKSSKYLNDKDTSKHKKFVKNKLKNIDKTGKNVSKQVKRISRKLKDLSKDKINESNDNQSSSSSSSSSDEEKQNSINTIIEKKLESINKSLYEKFIKAIRKFKKKFKDKRSYDLQRILAFIVEMENRKRKKNFSNSKPKSLLSFGSLTKQCDLLPICEIEKASTNIGNEFQKTIEGLLSHISDSGLDNIFSQWGEISKKTKSKKKPVKKLSSNKNKSLVESLNSHLGALNDNCSDVLNYPGDFVNQNKMISSLTSSNTGYPLIPPINYPIPPINYSSSPINYSQVPPLNYPLPFPPQPLPQLNYAPPMKYQSNTQFANQLPIYPMDSQKPCPLGTNFQNITPQEILSSVYTNFNNISPLCSKPQLC